MKIAITTESPSLDSKVDPRFGRCPYFLIVETDSLSFEAIENPNVTLGGGAGIQSAQFMAEKGVKQVLTGSCGPNAHQALSAAGIGVIVGCSGAVRDVVEQYKAGRLAASEQPNVGSHYGAGAAPGSGGFGAATGMGRGGGRGMGTGRGRGRGVGRRATGFPEGRFGSAQAPAPAAPEAGPEDELNVLKSQAQSLNEQMQQIQQRIEDLEARQKQSLKK
jgi:predicted Fe-Mo cluster-binding NifX family protein